MKHNKSANFLIKRFYGIEDVLDEYKESQVNRFGNIAFITLLSYLILSTFIAYLIYLVSLKWAFIFIITSNTLLWFICLCLGAWFVRLKQLDHLDVLADNLTSVKQRYLKRAWGAGIGLGLGIYALNIILDVISGERPFYASIGDVSYIITALFVGVVFGGCTYYWYLRKLK